MSISITELSSVSSHVLAFGLPSGGEWIILLVLGLLIFGRRLPEVGRSLGRGIVEFKKGIRGIEEEIDEESTRTSRSTETARQELPKPAAPQERFEERAPYVASEPRVRED